MGLDARGLVHWVPIAMWSSCNGVRVEPSSHAYPTCLFCMASWLRGFSERRDRREHALDGEILR